MYLSLAAVAALSGPIDFAKVDRTPPKVPELHAPTYGLFLFGDEGRTRVWAVMGKSAADAAQPDVLYVDLDADGDLGEEGERFAGNPTERRVAFTVGEFTPPGTKVKHTDWTITQYDDYTLFSMNWRGKERTAGGYAPAREQYISFGAAPKTAPIYVPGHDRPFEFERWLTNALTIGNANDFKVFVGNRGSVQGTFTAMHQAFLPEDEYLIATLIYADEEGKEQRHESKLRERC